MHRHSEQAKHKLNNESSPVQSKSERQTIFKFATPRKLGAGGVKIILKFFSWLLHKTPHTLLSHPKTTSLLCGLLLTLSLPPHYFYIAAIISFPLFFWLINRVKGIKKICAVGYFFGFGFFAGGFYWIGNALLIDLARTGWLYPLALFLNGAFFGIFTILPALGGATKKIRSLTARMLLFAALWGFSAEWMRSWFFSGFPWNPLSSILLFDTLAAQALAVFGTYGLSAITAFALVFPARFLLNPSKGNFAAAIIIAVAFPSIMIYYGLSAVPLSRAVNKGDISVRIVQPSLPQTADWSFERAEKEFNEHLNLSKVGNDNPDFIIWGETASPFDLTYDREHAEKLKQIIPQNSYLITGMLHREFEPNGYDYKLYNSLALIDDSAQVVDYYSKNHLVPFGEYIPFRKYLPSFIRPVTNMVAEFGRGEKYQTITPKNFPEFAPLICYEIIFSDNIVRKNNDLKWIVLLTFDGWYGKSTGPYQHLATAQMRAIEEGITIVRSANSGISAVISPYGEILAKLDLNERGTLEFKFTPIKRKTLFGQCGNLLMWITIFILLICALITESLLRFNSKK